jgi:hypothetical protein
MRPHVVLLCGVLAVSACSSSQVLHAPIAVTIGQQLIDLKQAHTRGALSDTEYDAQRRALIDSAR